MGYKKVNAREYVEELLELGVEPELYIKATPVTARKARLGEEVVTMVESQTEKGKMVETVNVAERGDWIVTNKGGESYIVSNDEFHRLYGPSEEEGQRFPVSKPRKLIKIEEDIEFPAPWGGEMKIQSGGYLNIDDMDGIYGINPAEFEQTHVKAPDNGTIDVKK